MNSVRVGVLALQGGYQRHSEVLARLGIEAVQIRSAEDLSGCTALILPGGESTSMSWLIQARGLLPVLRAFAHSHPVLGTCAGLVLMARCDDPRVQSLELLDLHVERNAYGRQTQSFMTELRIDLSGIRGRFRGIFIRAPRIASCATEVQILARYEDRPVLVAQGPHMGMSFHPELTGDPRIHAAWLQRANAYLAGTDSRRVSA